MNDDNPLLPQEFYTKYLTTVHNIHFTNREIDVMACLLSLRGTRKIASLLNISPNTVLTYTRNVMHKIETNSREGVVDFIEKSPQLPLLKRHYAKILIENAFIKALKSISKIIKGTGSHCLIVHWKNDPRTVFASQLKAHLQLVGLSTMVELRASQQQNLFQLSLESQEGKDIIYILSETLIKNLQKESNLKVFPCPNKRMFIFFPQKKCMKEISEKLTSLNNVYFTKQKTYYSVFFETLQHLLPSLDIETIIAEFKQQDDILNASDKLPHSQSYADLNVQKLEQNKQRLEPPPKTLLQTKKWFFFSILLLICILGVGFLFTFWNQGHRETLILQAELIVPAESTLLNREELLTQIDKKLNNQDGIQTLALVGVGGAGKTTLARQYASSQKLPIVWEINAETRESLKQSVESLAYGLARSEEDNKLLRDFQDIKETKKRKEKILAFVREKLRAYSRWLLIFDNVEKFSDIQDYFPSNPVGWGKGKVLVTTRDAHIQQNGQIKAFLKIGELSPQEKNALFQNIMSNTGDNLLTKEGKKFLEKIPSYPLDISVAAYYLKATQISYNKYLNNLRQNDSIFLKMQEDLLKETINYAKTRYHIIVTSLQRLLNTNKEFADLLLLISLIDSQNIPRDLLNAHKNPLVVDNFICNLKKYSLITSESSSPSVNPIFSIHRNTQEIILNYLFKKLNLDKNYQFLLASGRTLENYISKANEDEDYEKLKSLVIHGERYLSHDNLIPQKIRSIIEGQLGLLYFNLSQDVKAKELLERSLSNLKKYDDQNHDKLFWTSWVLGDIYKVLGDYQKSRSLLESTWKNFKTYYPKDHINIAKLCGTIGDMYRTIGEYRSTINFFEKNMVIYRKHFPEDHKMIGRLMAFLGNVYVLVGNYQKGKFYLEKSLLIHKKHFPENHVNMARILKFQGILENKFGNYEKSKSLLEKSINIYKNKYSIENLKAAWVAIPLGSTYISLNKAAEAIPLLEETLKIHRKFLPENQLGVGMSLAVLGDAYRTTENFEKAKQLLEESLKIHCDHYGASHIETARVLLSLGKVSLQEENLAAAENYFQDIHDIFQKSNHPDIYMVYEAFADLYNQKMALCVKKGDIQFSKYLKNQATSYLNQALQVIRAHFSNDSPHIMRIQSRIKTIAMDCE